MAQQGAGQLNVTELVARMTQAAEAASEAAKATAAAVQARQGSSQDWTKIIQKPPVFEPSNREAELSGFRDWWWQVEQYLLAIDQNFLTELETVKSNLKTEVDMSSSSPETVRRSVQLFGLLASLLRGRPLMLLKGIQKQNGFEAIRQLFLSCLPSSRNRSLGLLNLLMQWPSFDMRGSLLPQILKLEDSFREYERIGGRLSAELKFATLLRCVSGQLRTYLNVSLTDSTSYDELREQIVRYDQSTIRWSNSMALGSELPSGQVVDTSGPMDVDRISKGKDKGKQKGKGKSKDKGKGKNNYTYQQQNQKGKGKGQTSTSSYSQQSGKAFGKGKGKSKDKGGGKSQQRQDTCNICGRFGHSARDCWNKDKVRRVDDQGNDFTTATSPDAHSEPATTQRVNRVEHINNINDISIERTSHQYSCTFLLL